MAPMRDSSRLPANEAVKPDDHHADDLHPVGADAGQHRDRAVGADRIDLLAEGGARHQHPADARRSGERDEERVRECRRSAPWPMTLNSSGRFGDHAAAAWSTKARLRAIIIVPSVAMNDGMRPLRDDHAVDHAERRADQQRDQHGRHDAVAASSAWPTPPPSAPPRSRPRCRTRRRSSPPSCRRRRSG